MMVKNSEFVKRHVLTVECCPDFNSIKKICKHKGISQRGKIREPVGKVRLTWPV
jgi:hypothetical protein